MFQEQNCATMLVPMAATASAASTFACSWDTKGFDYAKIRVLYGTMATNGTHLSSIQVGEHDTTTSASSMTNIAALSCASSTAASAANALPAIAVTCLGGAHEIDVDLRKRKRYMGLYITGGATTHALGAIVTLSRAVTSADTTTTKAVQNLASTSVNACSLYVVG